MPKSLAGRERGSLERRVGKDEEESECARGDRKKGQPSPSSAAWFDSAGLQALVPGAAPSPEALEQPSRLYQQSVRNSPLWDEMVRQFGEQAAERLLLQLRVEVR